MILHRDGQSRGVTSRARRRSFTLIELLVVMGLIAVLASITVFSVGALTREARLSSGKNTLMAALGQARGLAMKNDNVVAVVFRADVAMDGIPELRPVERQVTQIVIAQWSGGSETYTNNGRLRINDRFVPIPGVANRTLPAGIKIAGPWYDVDADDVWITQSEFVAMWANNEVEGRLFGLLYGPDGSLMTANPFTDNTDFFVDFNNNNVRDHRPVDHPGNFPPDTNSFWEYDHPDDEVNVNPVPFVAVYDDDEARELLDPTNWTNDSNYQGELTGVDGYITDLADRVHFNRYTGVVLK